MKLMARAQYSDRRLDGLKKAKSRQNISLTLRKEIMRKRFYHNCDDLRRRLDLLFLLLKRYTYSCKINEKSLNNLLLINKIKMQWKIENLA